MLRDAMTGQLGISIRAATCLVLAACNRADCQRPFVQTPLVATAGGDTARAIAAAVDTVRRDSTLGRDLDWVPEGYARGAGDTAEVQFGLRCWKGTDAPGVTVRIVPPGRVVSVDTRMGG